MNLARVARTLSGFALFFSLSQAVPLAFALLADGDTAAASPAIDAAGGFAASGALGLLAALLLAAGGLRAPAAVSRPEAIAAVGFAWCLAGLLGALPFVLANAYRSGADAVFESVSGLTTCGATVCGAGGNAAVEDLPRSLLLWRAMLHWMGGLGIILMFVVLLPATGIASKNLLLSEQVGGVTRDTVMPRLHAHARQMFRLYVGLTLLQTVLLAALGLDVFDAVCHAFSTLSTGGFSNRNASIGAYADPAVEVVVITFMFLAGTNFALLLGVMRDPWRGPVPLLRNAEFRVYALLTVGLIALVTLALWSWGRQVPDAMLGTIHDYSDPLLCLREAAFQVVSVLSCTGFCTADFQVWPAPALQVLLFCMFVGASTGSTAGGLKVLRLMVSWQLMAFALRRFLRPKLVEQLKVGAEPLPDGVVAGVMAIGTWWLACLAVGTFVTSFDHGLDLLAAFSANTTAMSCCGPAIGSVTPASDGTFVLSAAGRVDVGPYGSFGGLEGWTKLVLAMQMILGRLEILAPVALLTPRFWRR